MTATPLEFLPPRSRPSAEWIGELSSMLERRQDIVAAYYVTTRYLDAPETLQDELHFELAEPPADGGAPPERFRDVAAGFPWPPEGVVFTFDTRATLPRVRRVGAVLWATGRNP